MNKTNADLLDFLQSNPEGIDMGELPGTLGHGIVLPGKIIIEGVELSLSYSAMIPKDEVKETLETASGEIEVSREWIDNEEHIKVKDYISRGTQFYDTIDEAVVAFADKIKDNLEDIPF
jgi:hypothetical protein